MRCSITGLAGANITDVAPAVPVTVDFASTTGSNH